MKLFGITKNKINKNKNGENVPHLEITEVVLSIMIIYQHGSRVLYAFFPNKSFVQLLDVSPKNFRFLKTFNSEFSYIEVWFIDQNSKALETGDKINIILDIN